MTKYVQGLEKPGFFEGQPAGFFGFYWVLGLHWVFRILIDSAHQLSFYLYSPVLRLSKNLQIHYLLVVRSCKQNL